MLFEVEAPDIAAKSHAGQFLIVINGKEGERVPLTISGYDAAKGTVSFAFHEVGKTTKALGLLNKVNPLTMLLVRLGIRLRLRTSVKFFV